MLGSCQKDEFNSDESSVKDLPIEFTESYAYGLVSDIEGNAIANAEITLGDVVVSTDERGYFKVSFQRAAASGATLIIKKTGYFKNYKTFIPTSGNKHFVRVVMTPEKEIGQIEGTNGGEVKTAEGATISFPAEAFIDGDGNSYAGTVSVLAHWYDPSAERLPESMPGDLRGSDLKEERVQLATYGMMAVELRGTDGQELQLAEDKPATINFPLPQELASTAPETIQTWSLNENSGYWIEEAAATLVNGTYVAEVSHFSFWNCDIPFRPIGTLKGALVNPNGKPLVGYKVCVTLIENSMTAYAWTDDNGSFSGIVPAETPLRINVKNECGQVIYADEITVAGDFLDLGLITVNDSGDDLLVIGNLVCEGQPVSNGYAWILTKTGQTYVANVNQDGSFEILLSRCGSDKITIQGVNLDTGTTSDQEILDNLSQEVRIDNIETCDNDPVDPDEFIRYKINGVERLITKPELRIVNGEMIAFGEVDFQDSGVEFTIIDAIVGDNEFNSFSSGIFDNTINIAVGCNQAECETIEVSLDYIGGVDDVVEGRYMGTLSNPDTTGLYEVMGNFRIYVDEIENFNSIEGRVFLDEDDNSIANFSENRPAANIGLTFNLLDANTLGIVETQSVSLLGDWLGYKFESIVPGDYIIEAVIPTGYDIVDRDQGNDENLDSDVDPITGRSETLNIGLTTVITGVGVGVKQSLTDLDCNAVILASPGCASPVGSFQVSVNNWDSIQYNLVVTGPVNDSQENNFGQFLIEDATAGSYAYVITASNGASCDGVIELEEMNELDCPLFYDAFCEGEFPLYQLIPSCQLSTDATYLWVGPNGETGEGDYIFESPQGTYSITVTETNGCSSVQTLDLVFNGGGYIDGKVWDDLPNFEPDVWDNGLDILLGGITVNLFMVGDPINPVMSTETGDGPNNLGRYSFEGVPYGDYFIGFEIPAGYEYVEKESPQAPNAWQDSNVNPVGGFTDVLEFQEDCIQYYYIDAGIKQN